MTGYRTYAKSLTAVLVENGVEHWHIDRSRRHTHLMFTWRDVPMSVVFPASPSDNYRGLRNAMADLRRRMGVRKRRPGVATE